MGKAYDECLAARVVFRILELGQSPGEVADAKSGLGVSRHYVNDVMKRFEATGSVETHQGKGADHSSRRILTREEHFHIVHLIVSAPRITLKDHMAQFRLDTGVIISYASFLAAVFSLGYTRKKVRALAYGCDKDRANAWLAELLTYHHASELGILDETSKDSGALGEGYGYALRGSICSDHQQFLGHDRTRVSALVLHTLDDGFLDWAFTPGTFNKEYFLHVTTENFVDWRGRLRRPMLLDHIRPQHSRCSCILLDNASIHHCHEFVERIVTRRPGAVVRYIPPYCHFLSTLDNGAFGALVQWLQKNHSFVQRVSIETALVTAFGDLNADGGRLARSCFRRCRYL
jgi:transposase